MIDADKIFEEWFEQKKDKCEVYGNGDDFYVDDEIKKFCKLGYDFGRCQIAEWHYPSKGELPKCNKKTKLLLYIQDWNENKKVYYHFELGFYKTYSKKLKVFAVNIEGHSLEYFPRAIIAWREIIPPKEIE